MTRRLVRTTAHYSLLAALAVLFIGPFLVLLANAFKPATQSLFSFPPDLLPRPPVLTYFIQAWTGIPFPRYLLNSTILEAGTLPASLLVTALAAYPLARMRFWGRRVFFFLFLSSLFLPSEVMFIPRFLVASQLNIVDSYLGLILPALVGGFGIFLMRQAFLNVPQELADSGVIDGANELQIWWHIMVPQVRPALATLSIFGFVSIWNSFLWPLVVLKTSSLYPVALGLAYLAGIFGTDQRQAAAGALIAMVPILVFFLVMQRHFIEGLQGALKG